MPERRDQDPNGDRQIRMAVSRAAHHRRRRRLALLGLAVAALVFATVVATSTGSGRAWDPVRLSEGAVAELPKLRLEAQAKAAAAALNRQKRQRTIEDEAVAGTLAKTPFVRKAGSQHREVALTFDDGPSAYTQRILDTLKRGGAKATFFALGYQLGDFPLPLQRAVAEGHEIGNHTWNHADLTKLAPNDIGAEMTQLTAGLEAAGVPRPRLFRPPYGAYNAEVLRQATKRKMLTVMWTIDTSDYAAGNPRSLADYTLGLTEPGAIILMHDGGGNRTITAAALPLIVRGLQQRGYKLVTVPRLLLDNPPSAAEQSPVQRSGAA